MSYSQLDEGLNFDFIKVEKENIEEYESFITDYIGKVAETAVENGKLKILFLEEYLKIPGTMLVLLT